MGVFVDYVNARGPQRIRLIQNQRQIIEDPSRPAWSYYRPMKLAIRSGVATGDVDGKMSAAVARASGHKVRHFQDIASGFGAWWGNQRNQTLVPVGNDIALQGELEIVVRPDLGLMHANGSVDVVFLYLKEEPLSQDAADVVVRLLTNSMQSLHESGRPLVLDVRRGKPFTARRLAKGFDAWMAAEATGYATHRKAA